MKEGAAVPKKGAHIVVASSEHHFRREDMLFQSKGALVSLIERLFRSKTTREWLEEALSSMNEHHFKSK